jgi:putative NADH-flavin reductase
MPDEIIDNAKRLKLLAERFAPGQDSSELDVITQAARELLSENLAATDKELARLERLVVGAVKERDYWLNSVKSIEAEAKEGGFELHAYTISNPFKRKLKERQEQTRLLYDQCKANLEKQEGVVVSQQQRTAKESQRHLERKAKLLELISLLDSPRLGIAAAG